MDAQINEFYSNEVLTATDGKKFFVGIDLKRCSHAPNALDEATIDIAITDGQRAWKGESTLSFILDSCNYLFFPAPPNPSDLFSSAPCGNGVCSHCDVIGGGHFTLHMFHKWHKPQILSHVDFFFRSRID